MHQRREIPGDLRGTVAHGVLTAADLEALAITGSVRRRLVRTGELTRLEDGVYVVGRPTGDWLQRCAVRLAKSGRNSMISRGSAARLWGLDGYTVRASDPAVTTPIAVNIGTDDGRRGRHVFRVAATDPVALADGLRITGINQTLMELGAGLTPAPSPGGHILQPIDQVELALESALHLRYTTIERLEGQLAEVARNRAGATVLRAAIARRPADAPATESWLETRAVQVLRNAGITEVERQVTVRNATGAFIGRVDFMIGRVVIECDGREYHDDFEKDRERWADLHAMAYLVLPVTFQKIEFETSTFLRAFRALERRARNV